MAQKRKLNIPIYETRTSAHGEHDGEDIIDAEVIEDGPTAAQRAASAAKAAGQKAKEQATNARVHGVRDSVRQGADRISDRLGGPRTRRGQQQRARRDDAREGRNQREEQRQQAAAQAKEQRRRFREEQQSRLTPEGKLRMDVRDAGNDFMTSLRRSGIVEPGQTRPQQAKKLTGMHQIYASMMVLQCVEPLKKGLNAVNLVNVLGMGASMWLLSPNFRTQLGSFAGNIGNVLSERANKRREKLDAKAEQKHDKLASKGHEERLRGKWQKRMDRMEFEKRGHRLPFTAESAAMAEVALAESAYEGMRRPGADAQAVKDQYDSAISVLYGYVADDGLESADVSRAMRTIVGKRMEHDPSMASVFQGLGHGRFTKGPNRVVDGKEVWTGDFVDSGRHEVVGGSFSLRPVMDVEDHRIAMSQAMLADLEAVKDLAELNDALSQYMVGSAVNEEPRIADFAEDAGTAQRLGRSRTMFSSMEADGLSEDQRHFAYTAAYIDAVETAQRINPELGRQWAAAYGEHWQTDVAQKMQHYRDMGAQARREEGMGPRESRPGHPAGWGEEGYEDPYANPDHEDIVDAEVVEDDFDEPVSDSERWQYDSDLGNQRPGSARSTDVELHSTAKKIRSARVNQHYNEIETGSITGIGRDDATPLQDSGFELGG